MISNMSMIRRGKGERLTLKWQTGLIECQTNNFRGPTVDDKTSENIFMHIGNRFGSKPYECIAYKPKAKNNLRMNKEVNFVGSLSLQYIH